MAAEDQIAHVLYEHGVSHEEVAAALDAVDDELPDDERRENLYLGALSRFVGALGGQLEVRAVFGDRQVFVHRAPID
jgi:hypothetical protein